MPPKKAAPPPVEPEPVAVEPAKPPAVDESEIYKVTLFEDGSGTIMYPYTERIAALITTSLSPPIRQCIFMNDDHKSTILASFDYNGVGTAHFKNGSPRLVVTKMGWTQSNEKGDFIEKGDWPRDAGHGTLTFQLNKCFTFSFTDRQTISVVYSADGAKHEFDCGEVRKRSDKDTYIDLHSRGTIGGKVIMNIDRGHEIHQFTSTNEHHKYTPLGPHSRPTRRSGVNSLPALQQNIENDVYKTMVDEHNVMQQRLRLINTMPVPMFGTSREGGAFSLSMGSTASSKSILSASHKMFFSQSLSANSIDELPPIVFTKEQRKTLKSLYKHDPKSSHYKSFRQKIKSMRAGDLDKHVTGNPNTCLFVVVCVADWQPLCRKIMPSLEAINQEVCAMAKPDDKRAPKDPKETKPDGPLTGKDVKIVTYDMSASRLLQERYNFKCVPMFFCFWGKELVHASNTMRTKDDFTTQAASAIDAGMRGNFLPKDFRFNGVTNNAGHAILDRCM